MKTLIALSLLISFSALADFTDEHTGLCQSAEARKLIGKTGTCQLAMGGIQVSQVSSTCTGKSGKINCRVMMLKSSDSASMTLICGDADTPLLSQVLPADVMSYNVSAVVKTSTGEFQTINDPNDYHIFSNPALEIQLTRGSSTKANITLTIHDRAITLDDVTCE